MLSLLYRNRGTRKPARRAARARARLVLALGQERHMRELHSPREPDREHEAQFLERHL